MWAFSVRFCPLLAALVLLLTSFGAASAVAATAGATLPHATITPPVRSPALAPPTEPRSAPTCTNCLIATIPAGDGPDLAAYDATNGQVMVTDVDGNNVTVIDSATETTVTSINVGTGPAGIAFDPSTGDFWVANVNSDNLSVIDATTDLVVATITDTGAPSALVYDPVTASVYATNSQSNNVTEYSGSTMLMVANAAVGTFPYGIGLDPANGDLYVANEQSANVTVLRAGTLQRVATVAVGKEPWGVAYDPQDGEVFVVNHQSSNMTPIRGATNVVAANITLPAFPNGVAYSNASGLLYLSVLGCWFGCSTDSELMVYNSTTNTSLSEVQIGGDSGGVLYDRQTGNVYTMNWGTNNVSVVATRPLLPWISSFTVSPASVPVEGSATLSVTASGGTGSLSYWYTGLPPGCTSSAMSSLVCTPTGAGVFTVRVYVNDSVGNSVSATTTLTVTAPGPTISSFTVSPSSVISGNPVAFTVVASGGSGTLSYDYTGLPSPCVTSSTSSLACTPSAVGSFVVRVFVNDSTLQSANAQATLSVSAPGSPPTISSFTVSPTSVPVTTQVVFLVETSGGTGPLSYAYTGLPAGCASTNEPYMPCTPVVGGNYTVRVFVNDTASHSATATVNLEVTGWGSPSIDSFSVSPAEVALGSVATFTVAASGGTGTLSYAYAGLPAGCASSNATSLPCTATETGTFQVRVYVNDSASNSASATATLQVNPPPVLASVQIAPASPSLKTGTTLDLTSSLTCSGGNCPVGATYAWTATPTMGSFSSTTSADPSYTAGPQAGPVLVRLSVTLDGLTRHAEDNITVTAASPSSSGILGLPGAEGFAVVGALLLVLVVVGLLLLVSRRKKSEDPGSGPPTTAPPARPGPATSGEEPPPPPPPA